MEDQAKWDVESTRELTALGGRVAVRMNDERCEVRVTTSLYGTLDIDMERDPTEQAKGTKPRYRLVRWEASSRSPLWVNKLLVALAGPEFNHVNVNGVMKAVAKEAIDRSGWYLD